MNPENSYDFDINTRNTQDACRAIFYSEPVLDGRATRQEGRPVHKNEDFVKILIPGSRDEFVTKVRDEDKARFPKEWAAYQNRQEQVIDGTLLESWPAMDRATVADCRHMNILTVEDLAALSDEGLQKFGPGGREWQTKAKLFLEAAAGDAPAYRLQKENEHLQSQIDALNETVENLKTQLAEKKRGPGRPPKEQAA